MQGDLLAFIRPCPGTMAQKCAFHSRWELMLTLAKSGWVDKEVESPSEVFPLDLTALTTCAKEYYLSSKRSKLAHPTLRV